MNAVEIVESVEITENMKNAADLWLTLIEDSWYEYQYRVFELVSSEDSGVEDYPVSLKTNRFKIRGKTLDYYFAITDDSEKLIHEEFLKLDGGGDDVIEDCGCADSMREKLWRDALRKGRLTDEEKTLMPYEPWEAVITPPDYYGRFYHYLIELVGWDIGERDPELVDLMYAGIFPDSWAVEYDCLPTSSKSHSKRLG